MAAKPYRPKMTAAEKKAYKNRNFGAAGKTGGMGGKYGRKSENLTTKQLKASGALAASKKRTVDISQTKRDDTRGITLGPGGKPLTGTVKLLNGKTAVYKGGKRVQKSVATPKPKTGGRSSSVSNPKRTVTRVTPSERGEGAGSVKDKRLGAEGPKGINRPKPGPKTKGFMGSGIGQSIKISKPKGLGAPRPKVGTIQTMSGRKFRWDGNRWIMIG